MITNAVLLFNVKIKNHSKTTRHYDRKNDTTLVEYVHSSSAAFQKPRFGQVFCWVQTSKIYHTTRAIAVNETWLPRCDHGVFFTSDNFSSEDIPYITVFAGIPDTYANLFYKSHYAFYYIYEYISKEFEWYVKQGAIYMYSTFHNNYRHEADDDTYIIVEHLKRYLSTLDPNIPYYLGHTRRRILKHGYNSGSAYILSKAALKLYNELAYQNSTKCPDARNEDVGLGRCLASIGIYPHDTRNSKGQHRFNAYTPSDIFHAKDIFSNQGIFAENMNYNGYEAFASDLISFHHLTPDDMRLFDILLYRLDRP